MLRTFGPPHFVLKLSCRFYYLCYYNCVVFLLIDRLIDCVACWPRLLIEDYIELTDYIKLTV